MKTLRYLLLFFCALALCMFGQVAPSFADKRVALVIGNSAYQHTPALANPVNDANDIARALEAIGFDVTLKVDVEKRQMDQVVAQFARAAKSADAALFFYAGHGMQFEGKNFLMPVDAELQDEVSLRYEMTALDDVKAALQLAPGVKIMVLDACRNNPLADKFVRSISLSTREVPKVQGYARPEKAQGMIIVYATQADDVAQDGAGRNSPFSQAFLKEIKEPGLEVGTMFRRIGGDVYAATNGQQSPELSVSMVPEYYLNQSETDQTIWARIRTHADAGALHEFLDRYPNSFYAPDARALLDLLEREAREKAALENQARQRQDGQSDALRLLEEQEKSERAAAQASAHERDLAAKLAEAEAERQRLADELTRQAADQAAVEARNRDERERLQQERARREADLRAQIDKDEAAGSQIDKERLLREALDKQRKGEGDDEKARADRERVANEEKARQLQAEADRAEVLKSEIAQLEQDAAQAKARAEAEVQKAEDAKKAAAGSARVASIAPAAPARAGDLGADRRALVAPIEAELRRVGCYVGGDGDWDAPSVRLGVAEYARYAKLAAPPIAPDAALLDSLKGLRERVCPLECSPRETAVNGRCVAKACPRGELLSRDGHCFARPAPARETAPREVDRTQSRVSSRSRCFSFNGSQYCE